jgi:dihydroorotate dehydrogenase
LIHIAPVVKVVRMVEEVISIDPSLDWKEILEEAAKKMVILLHAEAASIRIVDPDTGRPWLGAERGGLSGAAVRPVALNQVREVSSAVSIPVVGMGGVASGRHALDLLAAGAQLVAVGTESFRDPAAGARVAAELEDALAAASGM